jgi:hypothetical protein
MNTCVVCFDSIFRCMDFKNLFSNLDLFFKLRSLSSLYRARNWKARDVYK